MPAEAIGTIQAMFQGTFAEQPLEPGQIKDYNKVAQDD